MKPIFSILKMFKVIQHHLQLFRLEAIIIKKLGQKFKIRVTDTNSIIKITPYNEKILQKNQFFKRKKENSLEISTLYGRLDLTFY